MIKRAAQLIAEIEKRRERFAVKAVLLDRGAPDKQQEATRLSRKCGIEHLIWQDPDHEAFLLRHLPQCRDLRPPTGDTIQALSLRWPGYHKGMTADELAARIDHVGLRQACAVEPDLREFLRAVSLFDPAP